MPPCDLTTLTLSARPTPLYITHHENSEARSGETGKRCDGPSEPQCPKPTNCARPATVATTTQKRPVTQGHLNNAPAGRHGREIGDAAPGLWAICLKHANRRHSRRDGQH